MNEATALLPRERTVGGPVPGQYSGFLVNSETRGIMTAAAKAKTGNGILDREELVDRALELQPLLREHAPKIDADRRLPDEVNTALTEAGMFRLLNPECLGQADCRAA